MQISNHERKKATQLIRRLTPPTALYKKYERAAADFIVDYKRAKRDIPADFSEVFDLKMVQSKLFKKNYLVAFVSKGWFGQIATHCNAVASPSLTFLDLSSPPLIVIPGKSIPKSKGFSSIVEHEFVHVNQGIFGRFPEIEACDLTAEALFGEIIKVTHAEFEANFIQLVHDQTLLLSADLGVGLEKWCLLRGYTQGLEAALLRITVGNVSLKHQRRFLKWIQDELPAAFKAHDLNHNIGHEFARDIEHMSKVAMLNLQQYRPELRQSKNYMALFKWIFRENIKSLALDRR
jgi:hypothetical protein